MRAASSGLRHPASASCLGRHSHLAGRCPNSCSLFPPLAAVVVVAAERLFLIEQCRSVCGRSGIAFSQMGSWRKTAFAAPLSAKARRCGESGLALSVTCGDSSPKGRAGAGAPERACKANGCCSSSGAARHLPPTGGRLQRQRYSFRLKRKACGRACSPLGELSRSD